MEIVFPFFLSMIIEQHIPGIKLLIMEYAFMPMLMIRIVTSMNSIDNFVVHFMIFSYLLSAPSSAAHSIHLLRL